jgi:hypothetical protein
MSDKREAFGIHESGHVIVALVLGVPVIDAELRDHETKSNGVVVHAALSGGVVHHEPTDAVSNSLIALAGPCAEAVWLDQRGQVYKRRGFSEDLDEAARSAAELFGPEDAPEVIAVLAQATAAALKVAWPEVEKVAAALVERGHVTGAELEQLVDVPALLAAVREDESCTVFHGLPATSAEVQAMIDALPVDPAEPPEEHSGTACDP